MGAVAGLTFVCPGESYNYSVNVNLPGGTAEWEGDVDSSGRLNVPSTAVDGDTFSVIAKVDSCSAPLTVNASDGTPGDTGNTFNCISNPWDCETIWDLDTEAKDWARANETALGGGYAVGCADAARHAYFSAIATLEIGAADTREFTDAHENSSNAGCEDNNMDLNNNAVGETLGQDCTNRTCVQEAVRESLANGDLMIWRDNQPGGSLVPSSECHLF